MFFVNLAPRIFGIVKFSLSLGLSIEKQMLKRSLKSGFPHVGNLGISYQPEPQQFVDFRKFSEM